MSKKPLKFSKKKPIRELLGGIMTKVIDLFGHRKQQEKQDVEPAAQENTASDLEAIMKANREKQEKLKEERLSGNKKVLKSYRIDSKK